MLEENINGNDPQNEEKPEINEEETPADEASEDLEAEQSDGEDADVEESNNNVPTALNNELTDYIQKQIELISSQKEGKSVAKISQNEDVVDALKFGEEYSKLTRTREKRSALMNINEITELVNQNQVIKNYEIEHVVLRHKTVTHDVIFDNCDIQKLNLQRATFTENVQFKHCRIIYADLTKAKFEKNLSFVNCTFEFASIKDFNVAGTFKLMKCSAKNRCRIGKVKAENFHFWDSRFKEWLEINACEVTGDADMRSMNVTGGIEFVRSKFNNLILRGANVEKPIYMRNTKISGVFDFQRAKFRDYAYFEELEFGKDSQIALWNAISYGIFITPEQVKGRLRSEAEGDYATAASEYGALKANYQFLSKLDDEDWAYFRFKKMTRLARKKEKRGIRKRVSNFFEWLFFEFGSRYGTSPLRVLGLSLIFILVFAGIYFFPVLCNYMNYENSWSVMKYYEISGLAAVDVPVSALLHSTSAFVSGFDAVDKNVDGWVSIFLALEALAGMLFLGLFIVSFSRKVIR